MVIWDESERPTDTGGERARERQPPPRRARVVQRGAGSMPDRRSKAARLSPRRCLLSPRRRCSGRSESARPARPNSAATCCGPT